MLSIHDSKTYLLHYFSIDSYLLRQGAGSFRKCPHFHNLFSIYCWCRSGYAPTDHLLTAECITANGLLFSDAEVQQDSSQLAPSPSTQLGASNFPAIFCKFNSCII